MNMNTQDEPTEQSVMNKEVKIEVLGEKLNTDKILNDKILATMASGLE